MSLGPAVWIDIHQLLQYVTSLECPSDLLQARTGDLTQGYQKVTLKNQAYGWKVVEPHDGSPVGSEGHILVSSRHRLEQPDLFSAWGPPHVGPGGGTSRRIAESSRQNQDRDDPNPASENGRSRSNPGWQRPKNQVEPTG